jgi:hypothetical protein
MNKMAGRLGLLLLFAFAADSPAAMAGLRGSGGTGDTLPVQVTVATNSAEVRIGSSTAPLADLSIRFDDATGLSAANLGITAQTINISNPALLARLPSSLTSIPGALPLLITVEPPLSGGLVQKRVTHVELHTHALAYVSGSPLRLFKAPLNGPFRDITESVQPGSVRTRGTTPGWSQFIVIVDLRPSTTVIAEKIAYLRNELGLLSSAEAAPLASYLNTAEAAVAAGQYDDAAVAIDAFIARVASRSGTYIPDTWRAARDLHNSAGELLSGANTLQFSVGFLRDYGM